MIPFKCHQQVKHAAPFRPNHACSFGIRIWSPGPPGIETISFWMNFGWRLRVAGIACISCTCTAGPRALAARPLSPGAARAGACGWLGAARLVLTGAQPLRRRGSSAVGALFGGLRGGVHSAEGGDALLSLHRGRAQVLPRLGLAMEGSSRLRVFQHRRLPKASRPKETDVEWPRLDYLFRRQQKGYTVYHTVYIYIHYIHIYISLSCLVMLPQKAKYKPLESLEIPSNQWAVRWSRQNTLQAPWVAFLHTWLILCWQNPHDPQCPSKCLPEFRLIFFSTLLQLCFHAFPYNT